MSARRAQPRSRPHSFSRQITEAARVLAAGGVVAYPTEGVYGVGCRPDDVDAIRRILTIKRRSWRKGLLLIAARVDQLEPWIELPDDGRRAEILAGWPGPVTWILPVRPGVPHLLTGGRRTLAVRVTDHPTAAALSERARSPLVSTSANRSRHAPLLSALAVRHVLGPELDYVLGGPLGDLEGPTPIRDGSTGSYLRT